MKKGSRFLRYYAFAALLALAVPALAAPVTLREVAQGLSAPLEITHAGDGSGRLFVVEKGGHVMIVKGGAVLAAPFLDVGLLVSTSSERGLLGLAFHPLFGANRKFYVFYTRAADGAIVVSEFLASTADPDRADATSERVVIVIPHADFGNHNGGRIAFGPNGYLYIGVGDGGSGGDPANNGQDTSSLLGKLLRIDVNVSSGYAVPASNPFVGQAGYAPEIWAWGLRNPWKFSFDRLTGDLYIGDVGQNSWEEINFEAPGQPGGRNYGWRQFEGTHCYNPSSGCSLAGHAPPVLEYGHDAQGGNSVTGGYVYRGGNIGSLWGSYVYGDFVSNRVWAAKFDGAWSTSVLIEPPGAIAGLSSFGEDEAGELYVASLFDGRIYVLEAAPDTQAPSLEPGFNLIGNTLDVTLNVASVFGNQDAPVAGMSENIASIWKWNAVGSRWAFYSPQLTLSGIATYVASKGYEVLSAINPGEGYWVNALTQRTLPAMTGLAFNWNGSSFSALPAGFNLIATANNMTPSHFNNLVSLTPPSQGATPTANFVSLWAWEPVAGRWYFYSPLLEVSGGLTAVKGYADSHFFRHFQDDNKKLGIGTGFWVNKP